MVCTKVKVTDQSSWISYKLLVIKKKLESLKFSYPIILSPRYNLRKPSWLETPLFTRLFILMKDTCYAIYIYRILYPNDCYRFGVFVHLFRRIFYLFMITVSISITIRHPCKDDCWLLSRLSIYICVSVCLSYTTCWLAWVCFFCTLLNESLLLYIIFDFKWFLSANRKKIEDLVRMYALL